MPDTGQEQTSPTAWRVGRSLGRTLYIGDNVVGMVDSPELASVIVHAVNIWRSHGLNHEHLWQSLSSFGDDYQKCLGCGVTRDADRG